MSAVHGYAEVAADLDKAVRIGPRSDAERWMLRHAADLLAGVAATLPPCPTCGGTGLVEDHSIPPDLDVGVHHVPCPDCPETPGKVSIEQLAALWQAVHDDRAADPLGTLTSRSSYSAVAFTEGASTAIKTSRSTTNPPSMQVRTDHHRQRRLVVTHAPPRRNRARRPPVLGTSLNGPVAPSHEEGT